MTERLSPAKVILLAVNFAIDSNIPGLQAIISQYKKTLRVDLVLRILLTYLPEILDASEYVPLLQQLALGNVTSSDAVINLDVVHNIEEQEAVKKVRKLHLDSLLWSDAPLDVPSDPIIQFVIHRTYKIDQATGLSTQLPELIVPFLERSPFLRSWLITTLLPLLRLNYEYYPNNSTGDTIASFEKLNDQDAVQLLLSRSGHGDQGHSGVRGLVGRDLRGLVGPWMYGSSIVKRRKLNQASIMSPQTVASLDESPTSLSVGSWDIVFQWILSQASTSWPTCVEAIEQWDGPGDVDTGGYADDNLGMQQEEQTRLETRYARTALAAAYTIHETSLDALDGAQRILSRLVGLLDFDRIPSLHTAASLLPPLQVVDEKLQSHMNAIFLRQDLMLDSNPLTAPSEDAMTLLHAFILSAFILTRFGVACNIRKAGQLALLQDEHEQLEIMRQLLTKIADGPKGDDKYWMRARNELLWLRSWGREEDSPDPSSEPGRGILGQIPIERVETEFLKGLLANTRYTLARSLYESSTPKLLSKEQLMNTVVTAALQAYDNASNLNRTRGGVKKCDEIINSFPETMGNTLEKKRLDALLKVTHSLGQYRLVLRQGEPFTPVDLHVHKDPIALLGKVLEQNPQSYTRIQDFIDIAAQMIDAGLNIADVAARKSRHTHQEARDKVIAKDRVQAMCIDAALDEDDFETAYSYIMTRLATPDKPPKTVTCLECRKGGTPSEPSLSVTDDYSWRAALQAGKYRMNARTIRPTHVGNSSGNLEIRHLEQRLECISLSLRLAPPSTLSEILSVYRRSEEELDAKLAEEAAAEAAWDDQGDSTAMPGGFGPEPAPVSLSRHTGPKTAAEEGPVSIFDLTKSSAASAQKTLSALSGLRLGSMRSHELTASTTAQHETDSDADGSNYAGSASASIRHGPRKRDQLREAAVGTLASGVGWLIGAPVKREVDGGDDD